MIHEKDILNFIEKFCKIIKYETKVHNLRTSRYFTNKAPFEILIQSFNGDTSSGHSMSGLDIRKLDGFGDTSSYISFARHYENRDEYECKWFNFKGRTEFREETEYSGEYKLHEMKNLIYEFMEPVLEVDIKRRYKLNKLLN